MNLLLKQFTGTAFECLSGNDRKIWDRAIPVCARKSGVHKTKNPAEAGFFPEWVQVLLLLRLELSH
jgi:hypothetical protein